MSKNNTQIMDQAPRISWSVIFMAAGMIVSAAFNYATYDTRITVLEKQILQDAEDKKDLQHKVDILTDLAQKTDTRTQADGRDLVNVINKVDKLETRVDHITEIRKGK